MKTATQTLNQIAAMTAMFARQPRLALTALERGDAEGSSSVIRTAAAVGLALLVVTVIVAALVAIVNATGAKISSATFP
ncbi:MAG TPA: hypothetical protein PLG23_09305 [Thermoflexales bacterium]|jgi:hypothetical protein|nr:hypothetical protein [Anaerolineae bacterium]HQV28007.1 hypothetical protein [Thermoflexales bacterium]HQX10619.1 hypothetical protein [Thermoflexales bacterium]HQY23740.1 hypothetical protein [Thermoflexales bacterium]HQZ53648.1 hypothetical protein [Thermoflexales bacterium]